jgi:hypothetical protein
MVGSDSVGLEGDDMTLRIVVGCLLVWLTGCASTPHVAPAKVRLVDREIHADKGSFVFRNVILDASTLPGSWIITGIVGNNTGREWKRVVFDFHLYDLSGSAMSSYLDSPITVTANSLNNDEEQRFATNYFRSLRPDALQSVWKYEVMYKDADLGKQIFVMVKPWESKELIFEDQAIRIRFTLSETQIGIRLQNKMPSPIKVDWNTISYVDIAGLAHSVMHTGVRYIERDRPQVATVIPPEAMIEDAIVPSDHISYTSGSGGGWSSRPLFPALAESNLYIGKLFSVFMPLELEGMVKNYLFSFRVEREFALLP